MNPVIVIAEGTPAKLREQNDVRCPSSCVQHSSQHRGFVRRLQNQRPEWFPVGRWHAYVGHWEGRAEGLRDQRPMFPCGIGDFDVVVHADTQLAAQDIDLPRCSAPRYSAIACVASTFAVSQSFRTGDERLLCGSVVGAEYEKDSAGHREQDLAHHPPWWVEHNVVYSVGATSTQVGLGRGSTFAARCKLGSTVATLAPKRTPYI